MFYAQCHSVPDMKVYALKERVLELRTVAPVCHTEELLRALESTSHQCRIKYVHLGDVLVYQKKGQMIVG